MLLYLLLIYEGMVHCLLTPHLIFSTALSSACVWNCCILLGHWFLPIITETTRSLLSSHIVVEYLFSYSDLLWPSKSQMMLFFVFVV